MNKNSQETALAETIIQTIKEKNPKTVKQLASLVKERAPISEQEILNQILKMQSEGKIKLAKEPQPTPPKLATYLKTEQASWYWVTLGIAAATTLAVFLIPENSFPLVYLRYGLGTIFILWLPGYTFIKALFPEKGLDNIERIALSLGMSLALVPIVGLLLNYTPFGIRLTPIMLSLLAMTITFATVAVAREYKTGTRQEAPVKENK